MIFGMVKNLDKSCFRFVTMHTFDRQTDGRTDKKNALLDRVCIPCSAVKIITKLYL